MRPRPWWAILLFLIITLPDNTVLQIPDDICLRKFLCAMDNTYCRGNEKREPRLYGKNPNNISPKRPGWMWRI